MTIVRKRREFTRLAAVFSNLQSYFAFLGNTNVEFIRAEGTAMGDELRQRALDTAWLQRRRWRLRSP